MAISSDHDDREEIAWLRERVARLEGRRESSGASPRLRVGDEHPATFFIALLVFVTLGVTLGVMLAVFVLGHLPVQVAG